MLLYYKCSAHRGSWRTRVEIYCKRPNSSSCTCGYRARDETERRRLITDTVWEVYTDFVQIMVSVVHRGSRSIVALRSMNKNVTEKLVQVT